MQAFFGFLTGVMLTLFGFFAFEASPAVPPSPLIIETATSTPETIPQEASGTYRVIKVVDGDTLTIDKNGTPTTLRLIGLDTPESSTTRTGAVECFGREATAYARSLLDGASVTIEQDDSQDTFDRYGRLLVYAYLPDGTLINKRMIEAGFGHEYTYREPYRYQSEFKAAETSARESGLGLWAAGACPSASRRTDQAAAAAIPSAGSYECTKNVYNCSSFATQAEAQAAFDACGGSANDIHKLDGNGDGEVCESLP